MTPVAPPRHPGLSIYYAPPGVLLERDGPSRLAERAESLGFNHLLLAPPFAHNGDIFRPADHERSSLAGASVSEVLRVLSEACAARNLRLMLDLDLSRFDAEHPLVTERPEAFTLRREAVADGPIDPRTPTPPRGMALARLRDESSWALVSDWILARAEAWIESGLSGFRLLRPDQAEPARWTGLLERLRRARPDLVVIADTPGLSRQAAMALAPCGFDALVSSSAWWDGRSPWLVEEHEDLRPIAPLLAQPEAPFGPRLASRLPAGADLGAAYVRALRLTSATGAGMLMPMGFEAGERIPLSEGMALPIERPELAEAVKAANRLTAELAPFGGEMRMLTGSGAPATAFVRASGPDLRTAQAVILVLANPSLEVSADLEPATFLPAVGPFGPFEALDGREAAFEPLAAGEVRLLGARRSLPITSAARGGRQGAKSAAKAPRLVIEEVSPHVSGGAFAVKRIVGETVEVTCAVYGDGHEELAVELRWRAADSDAWSSMRMAALGNDAWRGALSLERLGRHQFTVQAWIDRYGTYRRDLSKKIEAGVAQAVDFEEGRLMILEAAPQDPSGELAALARDLEALTPQEAGQRLLAAETTDLMDQAQGRAFACTAEVQGIDAERREAQFASWYELFPRSQTDDPAHHGTFDDVIARLPDIRAMGFDVLYFPPIHPIGERHRKGRNNSLTAEPGDPGSPYAIGSADGGHDAIHRELGTFEDFRRLVAAAADQGLEIALDFAIQCSPDHPWIKAHPGWFDWRPDGTIKYAENPPKKYQDIVNVDFYRAEAIPDLWLALRDVVLLWVREGVRTFRVDNPHTKPFAFWEWMIREVRSAHPDVIFLSEAFTRPRVMYRLAKVGFSQSYTYFTWRHTKAEFVDYLTELTTTAPKAFFRPNFFVNTPDINPYFLQTSGRAGFLIRAVLAATLSGLWGVYSGFELLESEPVPGKEEYKDSEKYEIRPRDWKAPHSIVPEITQLNRLRRSHPALQTHLNVHFLPASDDNILFYAKPSPDGGDLILVAVNLDPHGAHEADVEAPFWRLGLDDHAAVQTEDLLTGQTFTWQGKWRRLALDPARPYLMFRMEAPR
ncbi:maltotransferase domain-containing protein [Phenylobacterium sp.]|uniref:maltotransferase domain-containing protein n=1 Tax=Phenylobacterium sp. TaxID=1871053 RepID=UPI002FD9D785